MCDHYVRKCQIKCTICEKFYPCRHCHNKVISIEKTNIHLMASGNIRCTECDFEQMPSESCSNCKITFADYSCIKCRYYSNLPAYHCDTCNICYKNPTHICLLPKETCPICYEDINDIINRYCLPCGHILHHVCAIELLNADHSICPLCRSQIRSIYLCDYCQINLFIKGAAVKIKKLNCGHKLHLTCGIQCSTFFLDNIVLSNLEGIAKLIENGENILQKIKCPKCEVVSEMIY